MIINFNIHLALGTFVLMCSLMHMLLLGILDHAKSKKDKSKRMHGGALASLVDLVGSAVFYAGGSPTTGVSLEITISYINAARANVRERSFFLDLNQHSSSQVNQMLL